MSYVLYDLNAEDSFVSDSKDMMLADTKCVVQEAWRLLTTQVGEIPNFRTYGLDMKKFCQWPLTKETAEIIYEYAKTRIEAFVSLAEIVKAVSRVDFERGELYFTFYLRVRPTDEIVELPVWTVNVGG